MANKMKLIMENWKTFSENKNNEQIFISNVRFILGNSRIPTYFNSHALYPDSIGEIKILKTNKIIKLLGAGYHGIVYLLNNDHVLKLFTQAYNNDLERYEKLQNLSFSGTASINHPMIYDFGTTSQGLSFVEMNKVMPLLDWFELLKKDSQRIESDIYRLSAYLNRLQFKKENLPKLNNASLKSLLSQSNIDFKVFDLNQAFSCMKSMISAIEETGKSATSIDFKAANLGVLIQNPNIWVAFDI